MCEFRCLICDDGTVRRFHHKGDLRLAECVSCGFVQLHPMPGTRDLDALYRDEDHYIKEILASENAFLERDRRVLEDLARMGAEGPLLDVGAGGGTLMRAAMERGWEAVGLELSHPGAAHLRKIFEADVHTGSIEDAPLGAGRFGLVIFSHSLEHVRDPGRALRRAAELLAPGGTLHVAVPNWKAAKRRMVGTRIPWVYEHHLSYFSKATLFRILRATGFEPRTCRFGHFIGEDLKFVEALYRRLRIDGVIRKFLLLGDHTLEDLIGNRVRIQCPLWRFRIVNLISRTILGLWPEGLLSRLGLSEELRVTAVRASSARSGG